MVNTKVCSYRLINYFDVWGNCKDGWEINNQCVEMEDLNLTEDATNKDICEYLKKTGYLKTSDMRRLAVIDYGDYIEICERKGMKPLFGLHLNYEGNKKYE